MKKYVLVALLLFMGCPKGVAALTEDQKKEFSAFLQGLEADKSLSPKELIGMTLERLKNLGENKEKIQKLDKNLLALLDSNKFDEIPKFIKTEYVLPLEVKTEQELGEFFANDLKPYSTEEHDAELESYDYEDTLKKYNAFHKKDLEIDFLVKKIQSRKNQVNENFASLIRKGKGGVDEQHALIKAGVDEPHALIKEVAEMTILLTKDYIQSYQEKLSNLETQILENKKSQNEEIEEIEKKMLGVNLLPTEEQTRNYEDPYLMAVVSSMDFKDKAEAIASLFIKTNQDCLQLGHLMQNYEQSLNDVDQKGTLEKEKFLKETKSQNEEIDKEMEKIRREVNFLVTEEMRIALHLIEAGTSIPMSSEQQEQIEIFRQYFLERSSMIREAQKELCKKSHEVIQKSHTENKEIIGQVIKQFEAKKAPWESLLQEITKDQADIKEATERMKTFCNKHGSEDKQD
jgi:hypothetical protein